jgi:S-adenosylmethionine synthetase
LTERRRADSPGAANRFPDKCDKDPEGTRALNVAGTRALAKQCASLSALLIYISTDYVFPGTEGDAPYEITSEPKPTNLYGETKLAGERAVLEEYEKAGQKGWGVVLRVPVLYGEAESPSESAVNVLMDALWKAQEKDAVVKMDHWALRYPTNTEDVARVCQGMFSFTSLCYFMNSAN